MSSMNSPALFFFRREEGFKTRELKSLFSKQREYLISPQPFPQQSHEPKKIWGSMQPRMLLINKEITFDDSKVHLKIPQKHRLQRLHAGTHEAQP